MKPDINKIKEHDPKLIGYEDILKAAVLIPLIEDEILFEVRSTDIPDQPGDICLPGGMIEPGESPMEAAVRETCEELLIPESSIEILGQADYYHTANIVIFPFVGSLNDYKYTFSRDEVSEVFTVPVEFFMNEEPEIYEVSSQITPDEDFPYHLIQGGRNYKWRRTKVIEMFYRYESHIIWGMTARIINAFIESLK